jgi:hypothetical protein
VRGACAVLALALACGPRTPTARPPAPGEAEFSARLKAASEKLRAGDGEGAARELDRARAFIAGLALRAYRVAYLSAAARAQSRDWEGAASALLSCLPAVEARPEDPQAFWVHNAAMMLREAQGDLASALVECDQMNATGAAWAGKSPEKRAFVRLKELWHRGYLLRMLAERFAGPRREATLRYAQEALSVYEKLARLRPEYQDSIAVLEGFFAALDGRREAARAAAQRVHVVENGDLEDLYLAAGAFEAGGDAEAAGRVRARMRAMQSASIARPIMLFWTERDTAGGPKRFTPFHPAGEP